MSFHSLWAATAPDPAPLPPLTADASAEFAVIGGGIQGLSTAIHLAEAGGDVILLEAEHPGAGASGRNGGQVIPGLKDDPDALDRLYGPQATEFAGSTADAAFDLIARHAIDCDARRDGWIQAADSAAPLPLLQSRRAQWQARGADTDWLSPEEIAAATGTTRFRGGWRDRRAGVLHPLKYALGLARAAAACGVRLHRAEALAPIPEAGGFRIPTAAGPEVRARRIALAANFYATPRLHPPLRRAAVPHNSFQAATRPLSPAELSRILPGGEAVSEARRVGAYYRIGPENRLMLGGRGSFRDPSSPAAFAHIAAEIETLYGLSLPIAHHWFGRVAITPDHRIRLCAPQQGMLIATGFNGRGVALASGLGKAIAAHLMHDAPLPIPASKTLPPVPLHALHQIGGPLVIAWERLLDEIDRRRG